MSAEPGRRRYDSLRRTAQAQDTRAEIARAARRLFVSHGWAATTMRDVASEAGVSVPTVYAAYQNKTGLALALADAADLSADVPQMIAELEAAVADPARQLAAMAAFDRRLFERAGDVIMLMREAARTEPQLAAAYHDARRRADGARHQVFSSWPAGTLRRGMDIQSAADVYAALSNIDVYTTLTTERGWSPSRIERWWTEALTRELLAEQSEYPLSR
ncbi:TetR family transcriptional regulator [Acrocarpospora phusangensis]|uniref:TetR family transcriptional regulator n=1 Tax=Acrocarpospora phusangensis TaxID=1070424 RepID=A0A919QKW0_9ACTN|nr:TetR/AcrR family transcriptional regulator [Acrocarpospora phusangensis]GIH29631.1 TetR family transcriptional regulator [Acrocarpospora phusangensis]